MRGTSAWAGLADRPRPLRWPRLAETQRSEAGKLVEDRPTLKTDGVVRWRRADLRDRIAAKFNVYLHERGTARTQGLPERPKSSATPHAAAAPSSLTC